MPICGDDDDADYAECGREIDCDNCSGDDVNNNDDSDVINGNKRKCKNVFWEPLPGVKFARCQIVRRPCQIVFSVKLSWFQNVRCQIVRGVKLSANTAGVKLSAVSNCPGVKLS